MTRGKVIRIRDYDPVHMLIRDHERVLAAERRKARKAIAMWVIAGVLFTFAAWVVFS